MEALTPVQHELVEFRRALYRPTPRRTVVQWTEENLVLSGRYTENPGPFSTAIRPYTREPLEAWKDQSVSEIVLCWGSQTAKTTTLKAGLAWSICEDPSPSLWLMPSEQLARSFVRTRWLPLLEDSPRVVEEFPVDRHKLTLLEQHFRRCTVNFIGSNSPANLASRPIRILIADETDKFADETEAEADALDLAEQRLKAFSSSKAFLTSTPTLETGRIWQRFLRGDQRRFYIPCPHCGTMIKLLWEQVRWDQDARLPDRRWDMHRVAASAYYACQACDRKITNAQKIAALRRGEWRSENPGAMPGVRSYHLSSLYAPDRKCTWGYLAVQFLEAKIGHVGLKGFVNGVLAEPWKDQLGIIDDFEFLLERRASYAFGDAWPEEKTRVMSADRQQFGGEHYWWVIRAWGAYGKSRLIAYGRANSTVEIEEIRREHGVPSANAVIDSGFKASEVYRFCQAAGWKPFKGDDAEFFVARDPRTQKVVRRLYQKTRVDPAYGTRHQGRVRALPLYRWSNPGMKDLLSEHMTGLVGDWTVPQGTGREYFEQLAAEHRVEERDARGRIRYRWHQRGRDNHLLDCELMIMAVAVITGLVTQAPEPEPAKPG